MTELARPEPVQAVRQSLDRLQWKLMFSYTMVTVVVIVLLLIVGLAAVLLTLPRERPVPGPLHAALNELTVEIAPALMQAPPDRPRLDAWLREVVHGRELRVEGDRFRLLFPSVPVVAVVDRQGTTLASTSFEAAPPDAPLVIGLSAQEGAVLRAALDGDTIFVVGPEPGSSQAVAAPVIGSRGEVLGALYVAHAWPSPLEEFLDSLVAVIVPNALAITAIAAVVGALLGLPTARWLTRRLHTLSTATRAWGQGDFSVVVRDASGDEIGELGRELNRMAAQVQTLLHDREHLAALEERNRLARDLHDSVTQALYSVTLYAEAATRRLAGGETSVAADHLRELRSMAHEALQEMRLLIFELRPPLLEQEGLVAALQSRLEAVEGRAGLETVFSAEVDERLPPAVEEGLYGIAREALNNVLKHAQARRVSVALRRAPGMIVLEVADDGAGFDGAGRGGLGLAGMAERAERLGGRLTVSSAPGAGTTVRAEVEQ